MTIGLDVIARSLWHARSYAAASVLTLGVAISGSVVVFAAASTLLETPLPYHDAADLVVVTPGLMWNMFEAIHTGASSLSESAGYTETSANVVDRAGARRAVVAHVTSDFFSVSGVRPVLGRPLLPSDFDAGAPPTALISVRLWRSGFHASGEAIGQTITVDGRRRVVIGVLPADFGTINSLERGQPVSFDTAVELVVPLTGDPLLLTFIGSDTAVRGMIAIGRVRQGVRFEEARRQVRSLAEGSRPAGYDGHVDLMKFRKAIEGTMPRQLGLLVAAVLSLLGVACANAANLGLERLEARRQEMAMRMALGATTGHLARLCLAELCLVGAGAAVLALAIGWLAVRVVRATAGPAIVGLATLSIGWQPMLLSCVLTALAVAVVSVIQTVRFGRLQIAQSIHVRPAALSANRFDAQKRLVVAQVALAALLVVVGTLLGEDLRRQQSVDFGFRSKGILTAEIAMNPGSSGTPDAPRVGTLLDAASAMPGVARAAVTLVPPQSDMASGSTFGVRGDKPRFFRFDIVSRDYFAVLGIPLVAGRTFSRDEGAHGRPVAVVNRAFAETFWSQPGSAIGRTIDWEQRLTIVGVVRDVRDGARGDTVQPKVYVNYEQLRKPMARATILLLARDGNANALAEPWARVAGSVVSDAPVYNILTLERILAAPLARQRMISACMLAFALVTLLVAAGGVHGALSYAVALRTHEIGIRRALGGSESRIVAQVLWEGLQLILLGISLGLPVAVGVRWLGESQLVGSSGTDPVVCVLAAAVVLVVGVAACTAPAIQAVRVEPTRALRAQ